MSTTSSISRGQVIRFGAACLIAVFVPLWRERTSAQDPIMDATAWEGLVSADWKQVPLTERDRAFAAAQPGPIARFRKAGRRLVARRVVQASRRLHAASDCLRAEGYDVQRAPSSLAETPGASVWIARRDGQTTHVEEWLVDADGRRFSEVGEWYWQALLNHSRGPWVAYALSWPVDNEIQRQ